MLGISLVDVLYVDVVNYNTEPDVTCCVVPEAWHMAGQEVSEFAKVLCKVVMRDLAGLGEAVDSPMDIEKDMDILDER